MADHEELVWRRTEKFNELTRIDIDATVKCV